MFDILKSDFRNAKKEILKNEKEAIVAIETKKNQNLSNITSGYGGVFFGESNEEWPINVKGEPLVAWLQIATDELPFQNSIFTTNKLITLFIDMYPSHEEQSNKNNASFVVREYSNLGKLVPLKLPIPFVEQQFYSLNWAGIKDYPCISHFYETFNDSIYEKMCDKADKLGLGNKSGIKIGGWPTLIQREYSEILNSTYVMQLDMTENYMYADSGVAYIYKELNSDNWSVHFDSC